MQFNVTPAAKRNALTFCGLSLVLLATIVFIHLAQPDVPTGVTVVFGAAAGIFMLLGVGKLIEPPVSLVITPDTIQYLHRRGSWQIHWDNILRFDIPRVSKMMSLEDAPFLGFRLHDVDEVLQSISPRLASALLFEQRQLVTLALRHERPDQTDYQEYFDIPERYVSPSGQVYKGLKASFGLRMEHLRELLGYDLYVSANALDRDIYEFKAHLQKLQASRTSES